MVLLIHSWEDKGVHAFPKGISPKVTGVQTHLLLLHSVTLIYIYTLKKTTGWNDKIVILKKITLQLYFKTFIEKINSGNLIM